MYWLLVCLRLVKILLLDKNSNRKHSYPGCKVQWKSSDEQGHRLLLNIIKYLEPNTAWSYLSKPASINVSISSLPVVTTFLHIKPRPITELTGSNLQVQFSRFPNKFLLTTIE